MGLTHFPHGVSSFGIPQYGGGLGPFGIGMGKLYYVVAAKASTDYYYDLLRENGISGGDIYTSPATAYAATTAGRNDTVVVFPGAYDLTATLTWANANTHMVGLGGPNIGGDYSENNVVIYTDSTDVASVLTVTGQNSQFYNFVVENMGANAACLTAATINIYGTYWNRVAFHGNTNSTQNAVEASASLYIGAAGMYPLLENCIIGQDVWGVRAKANQGVLRFSGTNGRPNGGIFRGCQFLSTGATVTNCMVAIPAATSSGRGWLFDNCTFQHFNDAGASLNQAFYSVGTSVQKHSMLLHNCSAFGIDEWQDANDDVVIATMPITGAGGGLHIEQTGTAGT